MNRDHKSLELDKILALLAEETTCDDAAELALSLEPASDLFTARRLMDETAAAWLLSAKYGGPSFGQLKNVVNALRRFFALKNGRRGKVNSDSLRKSFISMGNN